MKKEENLHKEHRKRVKERFLKHGFETFDDHVILETLLFFTIPVKDTNPISHRLINKFGSLLGVFEATYDELITVEGIGRSSATFILIIGSLMRILNEKRSLEKTESLSIDSVGKYAAEKLFNEENECVLTIFIKNRRIIDVKKSSVGNKRTVMFESTEMIRRALELSCDAVAIAHNHPIGDLEPSVDDYRTFYTINTLVDNMKMHLFEYYIIKDENYYPLITNQQNEQQNLSQIT